MNYAPNGTLRQRHCEGSRLSLSTIVSYIEQIAPALQYAHNHKVIHRDIKPQNLLIGLNDEILLSDFGLAVVSESTSFQSTQNLAGTSAYMAPEQYKGKPRPASDQYALAVVVYEWLCGERPFQGNTLEIAMQHQFAALQPLREKNPHISPVIEQVVLKALAKNPKQRFSSVQAFATALQEACAASTLINQPAPLAANQPGTLASGTPPLQPMIAPSMLTSSAAFQQPAMSAAVEGTIPPESKQSPQLSLSNRPPTWPVEQPPVPPRHLPKRYLVLALPGIALLLAGGSYTYSTINSSRQTTKPPATAIPGTSPVTTYDAQVATHGIMFGFDAQHSHYNLYENILNVGNVSRLQQKWVALTGNQISSSPAVANGMVYVGSFDRKLYAFDAITGKQVWVALTEGPIHSSPAVANDMIYIGCDDGRLYAFNAITGKPAWVAQTGNSIFVSSPTVANGMVFIGSFDHKLHAFDAKTGKQKWVFVTGGKIFSSPAVTNGLVYFGSYDDRTLYAVNETTGKQVWATTTDNYLSSSPAVANGMVYIGSIDGDLYAFDAKTGVKQWGTFTGASIHSSPAAANGMVYVGSDYHLLCAFDALTGVEQWATPLIKAIYFSSTPEVANELVYIGSHDHKLYAFSLP